MASKNIKIRFKRNQSDNASDSLTTYSLMAVLAGSFFIQIIALDAGAVFITSWDKILILVIAGLSLWHLLVAIETVIDIFHFRNNNTNEEIINKYKFQLNKYNVGVILLITTFIISFWDYLIRKIFSCSLIEDLNSCRLLLLIIQYLLLIIISYVTFFLSTKKWRKDNKFIKNAEIEVLDIN